MKKGLSMLAACAAIAASAASTSPATEWAREEFTNCTARIFGCVPDVRFVLPGDTKDFADDFAALKGTDGYAVRRQGDAVVFVADCPKGHANGVHRWLERNSDIVWPRPHDGICLFTPRKAAPGDLACDYRDIPTFRLRYFGGGCPDAETCLYLARNGVSSTLGVATPDSSIKDVAHRCGALGAYCDVYGSGHDMERRWFPRKEFFKEHPEWWMEIDGERWTGPDSNFCETNPDFVKAYCGSVLAKIADLPKSVRIISINMEDTGRTCTCTNCMKAITLPDGSTLTDEDPAFRSTRFFIFFNEVARAVARARPDLKILQFAYLHLAIPPKVPVERNVILKFCPYPRNMRESVMEGPSNVKWRERVDGWLANTPELYWREYYFCQCIHYPRPIADTAAIDLRTIASRGVRYVYTDSPGSNGDGGRIIKMYSLFRPAREFYDMCAMEAWTVQRLFWDPSLDPETLRADFIRRTFGPAAPHVAEFYRILRDAWYSESWPSSFNDSPVRSAAQFIVAKGHSDRCRAALAAAEKSADVPARREWIAAMRAILERWIAEAPNYISAELTVPEAPQSLRLPTFRLLRSHRGLDKSGTAVNVCTSGDAFLIDFDIRRPGKLRTSPPKAKKGDYPVGDKAEFSFSFGGEYWQFAFGVGGDRFEAKGLDREWTCDWSVRTERVEGGWRAAVRLPFSSIGFDPVRDPSLRFMAMVSYPQEAVGANNLNYSLGGAVPHAPPTWTPLRVKLNPR